MVAALAAAVTTVPVSSAVPEPPAWQSQGAAAPRRGRIGALDVVRGAALAGMATYHFVWDLHSLRLTDVDPGRSAGWHALGQLVAGLFLTLSGFGLTLARAQGRAWIAALKRLLVIGAAAAAVTAVSWAVAPDAVITFGILHCIAVTNLLALGLMRLGSGPLVGLAIGAGIAPLLVQVPGIPSWTGLSGAEPATLDFRPVLPWLAPVLLGMVAGRTRLVMTLGRWPNASWLSRGFAWAGRRSLAIYLLHQPLLIATLTLLAQPGASEAELARTLRLAPQATAFLQRCRLTCESTGGDGSLCAASCDCVLTGSISRSDATPTSSLRLWFRPAFPVSEAIAACRNSRDGAD
jgi:uncharacterized membrane protein